MAWYGVVLYGNGIFIPYSEGNEKGATSFVATRAVKADSPEEAESKVKHAVEVGWAEPRFAPWNTKASPQLKTLEVKKISWWFAWRLRRRGALYVFGNQ